jgi:Ni,Fe-hydrogenase maturation factor
MKILVFGNPLVEKDSIPLKLIGKLRKIFPDIEFKEFDPTENLEKEGKELYILDAVEGIEKVTLITDLNLIKTSKIYSMHDFDLSYMLKILQNMGKIKKISIFGIPMKIRQDEALDQLTKLVKSTLL